MSRPHLSGTRACTSRSRQPVQDRTTWVLRNRIPIVKNFTSPWLLPFADAMGESLGCISRPAVITSIPRNCLAEVDCSFGAELPPESLSIGAIYLTYVLLRSARITADVCSSSTYELSTGRIWSFRLEASFRPMGFPFLWTDYHFLDLSSAK